MIQLIKDREYFLAARDEFGNTPVYIPATFEKYVGDHGVVGSFRVSSDTITLWPVREIVEQGPKVVG